MRGFRFGVVLAVALAVLFNQTPLDARGAPPPRDFSTTQTLRSWDGRGLAIPDLMNPTDEVLAELKKFGGSRLVLKVDEDALRKNLLTTIQDDVRRLLREARIGFVGLTIRDGSVEVRIRDSANVPRAMAAFSELGGAVDKRVDEGGIIRLKLTDAEYADTLRTTMHEAVRMVSRRVEAFHVLVLTGKQVGPDLLELLIVGLRDASVVKQLMQTSPQLTFRVIEGVGATYSPGYNRMAKTEVLDSVDYGMRYLVHKEAILNGRDIRHASATLDPDTKRPMVAFRISARAAARLNKATREHLGRSVAVALDYKVVATPKVGVPIRDGRGRIDGPFTIYDARELARYLRYGMLEASWIAVEEAFIPPAKP